MDGWSLPSVWDYPELLRDTREFLPLLKVRLPPAERTEDEAAIPRMTWDHDNRSLRRSVALAGRATLLSGRFGAYCVGSKRWGTKSERATRTCESINDRR